MKVDEKIEIMEDLENIKRSKWIKLMIIGVEMKETLKKYRHACKRENHRELTKKHNKNILLPLTIS